VDGFQPVGERETLDPFRRGGGFVPDPGAGEHRRDRRDRPEATHDHGFLACDIRDVLPKDDLGSMEHPFFSLSTRPDRAIRRYEHKGNRIEIAPGARGMATIWDKDILIYCISQLAEALNLGRAVSQTVRVTAHDILVATGRQTSGEGYRALKAALERLSGTRIRGCKPKPPKIPSSQFQPRHDRIQVDDLPIATEGVVSVQEYVAPRRWRDLLQQGQGLRVPTRLVLCEQPR
jgi:hypothetical protein